MGSKSVSSPRGNLRARPEIAKAFFKEGETILWEGASTMTGQLKFWIGVVTLMSGLIGYEIAILPDIVKAYPYFIVLYLILAFLPALAIARINKARGMFYYVTDQRVVMERAYQYRWLFLKDIGNIWISDRLSFVGFVGLENIYFQAKETERTPELTGLVWALYKKNGHYYQYPPSRMGGFDFLKRGEARIVKQIVASAGSRLDL